MSFARDFASPPFDKVPIVISASWVFVSVGVMLFPQQLVTWFTGGTVKLPRVVAWLYRILAVVNLVGAIHFLILFWR